MALERGIRKGAVERARRAGAAEEEEEEKRWIASKKKMALLAVCAVALPPLVFLLGVHDVPSLSPSAWTAARTSAGQDRLLGGLLAPGFDERSCRSRYQSVFYRKSMSRSPSPHLVRRLREQEALQRRCGPGTRAYRRAAARLKRGEKATDGMDSCSYLVLISYRGLGNRMLAMASAFLYALLTSRVLLVDRGNSMTDLFCEPFPRTSWLLPLDFPFKNLRNLTGEAPESYGSLVQGNGTASASELSYVYVHLDHACSFHDKLFYCDDDRDFLRRVPWVVMRTDGYFVPGLFLNPAYQEELDRLFPRKDSVFYLLSRYLFHPTNSVWGLITRFYNSYLRNSDELVGIQIRVFDGDRPFQHILDQILACTSQERLLPEVSTKEPVIPTARARSKAILVTGLNAWYYENIRESYWLSATATGEVVSVHQPSHEEHQHFGLTTHDMKALAEMYLLSMADIIVTSGWSTFGYVGSGLGGLTPWIMLRPENYTVPDPPCRRARSMEPCFHAPPFYNCRAKHGADTGKLVSHVQHCEDMSWALKLVDE